jgi:hypothetical protein
MPYLLYVELPELKEKRLFYMGRYSTVMSHHLCGNYQELPEVKVASNGKVH